MYVHGNVYKVPDISESKLNELADVFLIGTDTDELEPAAQTQARNMTASIYVVQQSNVNVTIRFVNDVDVRPDEVGGAVNAVSSRVPAFLVIFFRLGLILMEFAFRPAAPRISTSPTRPPIRATLARG